MYYGIGDLKLSQILKKILVDNKHSILGIAADFQITLLSIFKEVSLFKFPLNFFILDFF